MSNAKTTADSAMYDPPSLPTTLQPLHSGKVREIYRVDDEHILIVATDRISAFDVVLPDPIPGKGILLTAMSNFWFARTGQVIANHQSDITLADVISEHTLRAQLHQRSVIAKKLQPLPLEAIVRGYLIGSGWQDYQTDGTVCGIKLAAGLSLAAELPQPIFTPSTKAHMGEHDENISFAQAVAEVGSDLAEKIRTVSLQLYTLARSYAYQRGVIIADTKFEFGLDAEGNLRLMDEVLTPDSSRFWPLAQWQPGKNPPSFDKQYIRDYLTTRDWNKQPPAPHLPTEVIQRTTEKYQQAFDLLLAETGG